MSTATVPIETPLPRSRFVVSWRVAAAVALIVLAHLPTLWRYVSRVINLPHYEFVMLLPLGAAVLLYQHVMRLGTLSPGRTATTAVWFGLAVATLLTSVVFESPWFGAISSLFAVAAGTYAVGGRKLFWAVLPAWILLWLGIRLPLTADDRLSQNLQQIAAERASAVLNYMGEDHILDGNVIETPKQRYMVQEACSGVQSLFAITACALFFGLWMREPVGRLVLLMLISWWWVWLANMTRIIAVTVLHSRWDLPVHEGWGHDALGIILFLITLGLIVSSEHLLLFFLPRGIFSGKRIDAGVVKPLPDYGPTLLPALSRTGLAATWLIGLYLAVMIIQWLPQLRVPGATATPVALNELNVDFAPETINGWTLDRDQCKSEQRRADSQWGARSQTWVYRKGGRQMVVSVDYPFFGWHDLTICYRADGWDVGNNNILDLPDAGSARSGIGAGEKCVQNVMRRPEIGGYAYLLFTCFNDRQEAIRPAETMNLYRRLRERVTNFGLRLKTMGAVGAGHDDQVQSFQLQTFLHGYTTPTESDTQDVMATLCEFRRRLGLFLADQGEKS